MDAETYKPNFYQELDDTLIVMRDDLTDWLNRLMCPKPIILSETFLQRLSNGVILCELAQRIHDEAQSYFHPTTVDGGGGGNGNEDKNNQSIRPQIRVASLRNVGVSRHAERPKVEKNPKWEAQKRVNIDYFLKWCGTCGIDSTVRFETNGLIHQSEGRNVILTLYNVARMCTLYNMDVPQLVALEVEVDKQQQEWLAQTTAAAVATTTTNTKKKTFAHSADDLTSTSSSLSTDTSILEMCDCESIENSRLEKDSLSYFNNSTSGGVGGKHGGKPISRKSIAELELTQNLVGLMNFERDSSSNSPSCSASVCSLDGQVGTMDSGNSSLTNLPTIDSLNEASNDTARSCDSGVDPSSSSSAVAAAVIVLSPPLQSTSPIHIPRLQVKRLSNSALVEPTENEFYLNHHHSHRHHHQSDKRHRPSQIPRSVQSARCPRTSKFIPSPATTTAATAGSLDKENRQSNNTIVSKSEQKQNEFATLSLLRSSKNNLTRRTVNVVRQRQNLSTPIQSQPQLNQQPPPPQQVELKKSPPIALREQPSCILNSTDRTVLSVVSHCQCGNEVDLFKLSEGIYQIGSRIVFVRLLRHCVMVRVGGGWQELSQYMRTHKLCYARSAVNEAGQTYFLCRGTYIPKTATQVSS